MPPPCSCCLVHHSTNTLECNWGTPGRTIQSARGMSPQWYILQTTEMSTGTSHQHKRSKVSPASATGQRRPRGAEGTSEEWPSPVKASLPSPFPAYARSEARVSSIRPINTAPQALCTAWMCSLPSQLVSTSGSLVLCSVHLRDTCTLVPLQQPEGSKWQNWMERHGFENRGNCATTTALTRNTSKCGRELENQHWITV